MFSCYHVVLLYLYLLCVLHICPFMWVCVYVSGDCPWSTWSGVGSGSIWQRPRPGWLPGEVAYSVSFVIVFFSCHFHFCYCHVGQWFSQNLNAFVSLINGFIHSLLSLFVCLSCRLKLDLDIVKKARVLDDVSSNFSFQPFWEFWFSIAPQQAHDGSYYIVSLRKIFE